MLLKISFRFSKVTAEVKGQARPRVPRPLWTNWSMCSRCHYVCRTVWSQQRFYHLLTKEKPYRSRMGPRTLACPHQLSELLDRRAQALFVLLNSFVPVTEESHAAALSSVQFSSVQFSSVGSDPEPAAGPTGPPRCSLVPTELRLTVFLERPESALPVKSQPSYAIFHIKAIKGIRTNRIGESDQLYEPDKTHHRAKAEIFQRFIEPWTLNLWRRSLMARPCFAVHLTGATLWETNTSFSKNDPVKTIHPLQKCKTFIHFQKLFSNILRIKT